MTIIRHRVNTLDDLANLAPGLGAEIDLRSRGNDVILNHDAFAGGPLLDAYLETWASGPPRGTLILNSKEDGLEGPAVEMLARRGVDDFFFLDLTTPTTVRLATRQGIRAIAVRVSEFEPIDAAMRLAGLVDWAWIDSFTGEPPALSLVEALARHFRTCLVSPELPGFPADRIRAFRHLAPCLAAVCTKYPEAWR